MDEVLSQLTAAAVTVYALQALKTARWFPWVKQETAGLNRLLSALGALISAVGVHFAFDAAQNANGTYVVTITGATVGNIAHGVWHWMNQFALQQIAYDGVVSKTSLQTPQAVTTVPLSAANKAELQGAKNG